MAFKLFGCKAAVPCRCAIRVQTCDSARAASCWHSCALIQYNAGLQGRTQLVGAYALYNIDV